MQEIVFFNKKITLRILNSGDRVSKQQIIALDADFQEGFESFRFKTEIEVIISKSALLKDIMPTTFGGISVFIKSEDGNSGIATSFAVVARGEQAHLKAISIALLRCHLVLTATEQMDINDLNLEDLEMVRMELDQKIQELIRALKQTNETETNDDFVAPEIIVNDIIEATKKPKPPQ